MPTLNHLRILVALIIIIPLGVMGLTSTDGQLSDRVMAINAVDQTTATISGLISHSGAPIAGVEVIVSSDTSSQSITTGADGLYTVSSVPTLGRIRIQVHPAPATELARETFHAFITGDLTQNFDLVPGYRLEAEIHKPDGSLYTGSSPTIWAIGTEPLEMIFYEPAVDTGGIVDLYLRPGFYAILRSSEMSPYFLPPAIFDLREGDINGEVLTLSYRPEPFLAEPPDASLIMTSPSDADGIATITGLPGAVPPLSVVMVANLNAYSVDITASDANGAFEAELFAPPGASLLVKYDVMGETLIGVWPSTLPIYDSSGAISVRMFDGLSESQSLPGTMIYTGAPHPPVGTTQSFESVGALSQAGEHKFAGLWLTGAMETEAGTLPGASVVPGETVTLTANLHLSSPDIVCTLPTTLSVSASIELIYKFDGDGNSAPVSGNEARIFTPTGLPILFQGAGTRPGGIMTTEQFNSWSCAGSHTYESSRVIQFTVPITLPEGTYLTQIKWEGVNVPYSTNMPLIIAWYHQQQITFLPPLTVGQPATPRLPMTLFADTLVNGTRGVQAREDRGRFQMVDWVIFPPETAIIPRFDSRTGAEIIYQMEPGSPWLAATDRRLPNPSTLAFQFPSGSMTVHIHKPDGQLTVLGPAPIRQSSLRNPPLADGRSPASLRTGSLGDIYHLRTMEASFAYGFDQYGLHTIEASGEIRDIYGNAYLIQGTYEVIVAQVLDLDPAQLPATPYTVGDAFAPGLHLFPPVPADVNVRLVHMPFSDPAQTTSQTVDGKANRFGYFQPPPGVEIRFEQPGEFRVDMTAVYSDTNGTLWAGSMTWGNVVEGEAPMLAAHGRRGMDYTDETIDDMPAWFEVLNLPAEKIYKEVYYPYFSGDIHWGGVAPGDSIQPIVTLRDLTGDAETIYNILRDHIERSSIEFRPPPADSPTLENLEKRIAIGEAPFFITTVDKSDPHLYPEKIDLLAYWYGISERPDVRVREDISQDRFGVGYWGFDDTYNYQIGEPANGDQPGDLKWEFGGAVFRTITETNPINEYAIYSSLWVLLPVDDPIGPRVAPPFQFTAGGLNGGPILTIAGNEVDMLFLPKGVRPGDVLEVGNTVSFAGHVGPPLDSRVDVTITSPTGIPHTRSWHANKIGWLYDPTFDFIANEPGCWTVEVLVEHDQPYLPTGIIPQSHNTGTVLGTSGQYEFYVVEPGSPRLYLSAPQPGFITWPNWEIEPIIIRGVAPFGTTAVYYTIHDKGVVMGQGTIIPDPFGAFTLLYSAEALHDTFSMLSLTASEGLWEGLADEVSIHLLAVGGKTPRANSVTLIGEEVFIRNDSVDPLRQGVYLPLVRR